MRPNRLSGAPARAAASLHHRRTKAVLRGPVRLQRPSPLGPRGPGGGAQATRHVHRVHRLAGPHALPVGDHRQLGRRGAGRARVEHRRRAARRRERRGARPRPRHPGRHRAEDRALGRRGRLHQAARRRQVRFRLLRRVRRSARRRRLGRQRALGAPRRRGRPQWAHLGDVLPPRRAGDLRRRPRRPPPRRALHALRLQQRPAGDGQGDEGDDRHAHPLLGRSADLHARRRLPDRGPRRARPADRLPRAGSLDLHRRRARSGCAEHRDLPVRGRHQRVRGVPRGRRPHHRHLAHPGHGHLHRDRAGAAGQRAHGAHGARARVRRRHRSALGDGLRDGREELRQHHRDPEGRHPPGGIRAGTAALPARGGREELPSAQGRLGQAREGRRAGRPDGRAHGAHPRAAVRGPDEGDPRNARRRARSSPRCSRAR